MKKKFINGILMVALMFAATSSFVSCKDNVDDEISDIYAQLGKKATELQDKINSLQSEVNTLEGRISTVEGRLDEQDATLDNHEERISQNEKDIDANEKAIEDLSGRVSQNEGDIAAIKDSLEAIKKRHNDEIAELQRQLNIINEWITKQSLKTDSIDKALVVINGRIDNLDDDVEDINERIENILSLFDENFITSITVDATRNDIFGAINLPGWNFKGLATYYGTNDAGIEQFPIAGIDFNVGGNTFASYLEDYELPEKGFVNFESDYITDGTGNAGQIYFTINSSDYNKFDISQFDVTLENSVAKTAPIKLSNIRKSSALITWTAGKSFFEELGTTADNGAYVADATIAEGDLEPSTFQVEKFFNLQDIQSQFKQAIENVKATQGTGAKNIAKQIVREAGAILFSLYHNDLTSTDLQNNVSYSPQRIAVKKSEEGISVRKGQSALEIFTTAVKPLSYNTFWEYERNKKDNWIIEEVIEKAISKIATEIKKKYNECPWNVKIISLNDANKSVTVQAGNHQETVEIVEQKYYDALKNQLQAKGLDAYNDAIKRLLTEVSLGHAAEKAADRINGYLDKASNYIVNLINQHAITRALAPIIIFETTTGVDRLAQGMFINRGIMHAYLTSATLEVLAPAYKKYVAVERDGVLLQSAVLPGNTQSYDFDLSEPGNYKIILSCVDYFGYVITKKYDCYVL